MHPTGHIEVLEVTEPGSDVLTADAFRAAFRSHPAGVAVVTADPGGDPIAMTVSSLTSISASPPLMAFSASAQSSSTAALRRATSVVVHLLNAEQLWLAQLGATTGVDRFQDPTKWRRLPTGEPVFPDGGTWIRGEVVHRVEAGNAVIHVVKAIETNSSAESSSDASGVGPLVYHNRSWHVLSDASMI
ncbi:flavin reductase family protein [Microbacterium sp. LWS13-1.2]|uniref:Flavin reductase family protein n=1 Tax=Microbacterium sp. LWS13-1.2 TaxID=3135264 RepID=A0AAU6SBE1_9MICO